MSLLDGLRRWFERVRGKPLDQWFHVTFDEERVYISASPPGADAWTSGFRWGDVRRIIFVAEGLWTSDGVYVFTSERPESFVIPTEADGGLEFWGEVLRRDLFDPALAIEAAGSTGGLFEWPPRDDGA